MKISDIPNRAQLITDSQDVNIILTELGLPLDGEYGGPNSSEIRDFGADYAEIQKCACDHIEIHNGDC